MGAIDDHGGPTLRDAILVRHASTAWSGVRYAGRSDPWLSPTGRTQAVAVARALAAGLVSGSSVSIVSSPARRARQTARAIEAALRARRDLVMARELRVDPRWSEVDVGAVDGWTFERIERYRPELAAALASGEPAIDWPAGETASALRSRILEAWADVVAEDTTTIVVVSHAGPLRLIAAAVEGRDPRHIPFADVATMRRVLRSGT